jgi:hypothetical protein
MGESVEQRANEALGAEHAGPFVEGQVAGDDDRAALVALAQDLEKQLGAGLGQWRIAELVDDQQVVSGELMLQARQPPFVVGFVQFVDQGGGGDEANGKTLLAGRQPKPQCDMSLAGAAVAAAMTFPRRLTYSERASSSTKVWLGEGMAVKSKLSRLFTAGNLASLIRRSTIRRSRSIISSSVRRSR